MILLQILFLGVLVVLSAFFSGSETAITSLSKLKLKEIIDREKSERKKFYQEWLEHPERYLITILIGNTVVNILASSVATVTTYGILDNLDMPQSASVVVGISTGVMTFILLLFGEITPKTFAKHHSEAISSLVIGPIYRLSVALRIFHHFFTGITNPLLRLVGGRKAGDSQAITELELKSLMRVSSQEGLIDKHELEMLHSIFEFDDTVVREIMIPRVDMVAVEVNSTLQEMLQIAIDSGYSRLPIYEDRLDNILGVLYVKDLLSLWKSDAKDIDLRKHLRKPLFVPEAKKVNRLLQDFKRQRSHMAIAVDEYGGVAGCITIEDIVEEIVGEIRDEYDEGELDKVAHLSDGSYLIDAALPISEFNQKFSMTLKSRQADSLGGLLIEQAGSIPPKGSVITLSQLKFTIVASDDKHISKIKVELPKLPL
ncbi:MAG: hypothetical protein A3G34_04360 [Candidatus Lindowbacteria bacterium RIFCSPLOWO2_12_FULL_62_27]|nr:MAG: hypothetical protein A3G34_04360 [Candidatus Lindowbacteria bacterium RIFCSPLOWO2_12_FULL_62_27]